MDDSTHLDITRRSFAEQVPLFSGEDSVFAGPSRSAPPWLEPLEPGTTVLDVACGAAHLDEDLAPHVRQVVGIDVTPALLQLGAARIADAGIRNVLLQEGDATALPFVDASFDVVACRSSLHHFTAPDAALAEMARVCRPGGRVVVSDLVPPGPDGRDAFDGTHRLLDPSHVRVLLEAEIAQLLRTHVGPDVSIDARTALELPLARIFTDVADRDAVLALLARELAGGPATGFEPRRDGDDFLVTFANTVVTARRPG